MKTDIARIEVKNYFQKREETYRDILTNDILEDLTIRLTGQNRFTVDFIEVEKNKKGQNKKAINIGRLAIVYYKDTITYVSFSEDKPNGRNSFFQSFPTAMVRYLKEKRPNKKLAFYFLPNRTGNSIETDYHMMMYRLMSTIGTSFLNVNDVGIKKVQAFVSVNDFINYRSKVLNRKQNNSTYVTIDDAGNTVVYGKVYGASKKETTLITVAMQSITTTKTILFQFIEKELKALPALDLEILALMNVDIVRTDQELEKREFEQNDSLRSPAYISNLLEKIGPKKCLLCNCDIPQLIEGAHIYPVANIKRLDLGIEEKVKMATDGNNGLWLCKNHHKMLDSGIINILETGEIVVPKMELNSEKFVRESMVISRIPDEVMTRTFVFYVKKRLEV